MTRNLCFKRQQHWFAHSCSQLLTVGHVDWGAAVRWIEQIMATKFVVAVLLRNRAINALLIEISEEISFNLNGLRRGFWGPTDSSQIGSLFWSRNVSGHKVCLLFLMGARAINALLMKSRNEIWRGPIINCQPGFSPCFVRTKLMAEAI